MDRLGYFENVESMNISSRGSVSIIEMVVMQLLDFEGNYD
jgi:hypothetical protein